MIYATNYSSLSSLYFSTNFSTAVLWYANISVEYIFIDMREANPFLFSYNAERRSLLEKKSLAGRCDASKKAAWIQHAMMKVHLNKKVSYTA